MNKGGIYVNNEPAATIQDLIFQKEKIRIKQELCRSVSIKLQFHYKKNQEVSKAMLARYVDTMADGVSVKLTVDQDAVDQQSQNLILYGIDGGQAKAFVCQAADELLVDIAKAAEKERQWFVVREK